MSSAIEVQISDTGNGILVNIGNGQWSDKVGAGVLGWFVFAPLAVTAIVGSVQQKSCPEKYLLISSDMSQAAVTICMSEQTLLMLQTEI